MEAQELKIQVEKEEKRKEKKKCRFALSDQSIESHFHISMADR